VVVTRTGRVTRDGKERELGEGEAVNKTGEFFDKAGRSIENAWDKTKAGVKEAGKDIGDATRKAGQKVENAVSDKDNH
jgi:hypothetical protein